MTFVKSSGMCFSGIPLYFSSLDIDIRYKASYTERQIIDWFVTFRKADMSVRRKQHHAFTLVELLVVIAIIGMLIALLLPAVQSAREAARRMQCSNKIKQLSLALHTFHDANNRFPASSFDPIPSSCGLRRVGFMLMVLPYIEQTALYGNLNQHILGTNADPPTDTGEWYVCRKPSSHTLVATFLCPSDGVGRGRWTPELNPDSWLQTCFTNYRGSRADLAGNDAIDYDPTPTFSNGSGPGQVNGNAEYLNRTRNQLDMPRSWLRGGAFGANFATITSGMSNSVAFSEGCIGVGNGESSQNFKEVMAGSVHSHYNRPPQDCLNTKGANGMFRDPFQDTWPEDHWMGRRAFYSWPGSASFYTLLPPNSPSCASGWEFAWISASSYHPGGVSVSFLDASVRFINETIQTKNLHLPTPAQFWNNDPDNPMDMPEYPEGGQRVQFSYGVWAELGAVNSIESVSF